MRFLEKNPWRQEVEGVSEPGRTGNGELLKTNIHTHNEGHARCDSVVGLSFPKPKGLGFNSRSTAHPWVQV